MSKMSEALVRESRNFSMIQTLSNAVNLITAARSKLVSNRTAAVAELDSAGAELIKVIRALVPTHDLGMSPNFSAETKCAEGAADPRVEELLTKIRELEGVVDTRNAEIAELQGRLREALAVTTTAAAVVADEASPLTAPVPPDAAPKKQPRGGKPKRLTDEPESAEPKAEEPA